MRRWIRYVATALAITCTATTLSATPAHAATVVTLTDSLEWYTEAQWRSDGPELAFISNTKGYSRTGVQYGILMATTEGSWAGLGRQIKAPASITLTTVCTATIYIDPGYSTRLNVELIDPATWRYVTLRKITLDGTGGEFWFSYSISWYPAQSIRNPWYRVSIVGTDPVLSLATIDDLSVRCTG